MKLAAIDIGSNGVRLLISRPLNLKTAYPLFKKVEFTRLPLRLGDDVFRNKEISKKKADLLGKAMKAFSLLMDIYNVDFYRACATSAMRDAKNSDKVIKKIYEESGIQIETISGLEESGLIINSFLRQLENNTDYIHIDVGGGSTEISHIKNRIIVQTVSFSIGTVRLREGKVKPAEWQRMEEWVSGYFPALNKVRAIGTGGNISKIYSISGVKGGSVLSLRSLRIVTSRIMKYDQNARIYKLQLNPDRAEVIDYAGDIYLKVVELSKAKDIVVPNYGLKDGILQKIWLDYHAKSATNSYKTPRK